MAPTMDDAARLAALDDLLAGPPTRATWTAILTRLLAWPAGDRRTAAIAHADERMAAWPDAERHLMSDWGPLYEGRGLSEVARLVRSLELYRRSDQGTLELTRIAGSPHLTALRALRLVGCDLGPEAWQALAASPHLRALDVLEIHHCDVDADELAAVVASPVARGLRRLKLSRLGLRAPQLAEILSGYAPVQLVELDLSMNVLGPKGVAALLAAGPALVHLKRLVLGGNPLGDDGRAALAAAPALAGVTVSVEDRAS